MTSLPDIDAWMCLAIAQAGEAAAQREVPVGAVLLRDDEPIAVGHNRTEQLDDPSAHAEILVLREAGRISGDWRLDGSTLVVTLEPCPMCLGAIIMGSTLRRLRLGARASGPGADAASARGATRYTSRRMWRTSARVLQGAAHQRRRGLADYSSEPAVSSPGPVMRNRSSVVPPRPSGPSDVNVYSSSCIL